MSRCNAADADAWPARERGVELADAVPPLGDQGEVHRTASRPEHRLEDIVDFEFERNGVADLFVVFAPLLGWRWVKVPDRRTRHDWAHLIRELVDDIFPCKKIVLVMDNLNTPSLASLYEAFEPTEARRIAECLEIHYTL